MPNTKDSKFVEGIKKGIDFAAEKTDELADYLSDKTENIKLSVNVKEAYYHLGRDLYNLYRQGLVSSDFALYEDLEKIKAMQEKIESK